MIYNDLKSAIEKVKIDFINRNEVENITDWQGNIDYKDEEMLVTRNIAFEANVTNDVRLLQIETGCDLPWAEGHFQERVSYVQGSRCIECRPLGGRWFWRFVERVFARGTGQAGGE